MVLSSDASRCAAGAFPSPGVSPLRLTRIGIDTYRESVVYMHRDCGVCRSEGFESLSRVVVSSQGRSIVATLNVLTGERFAADVAGLSEAAWRRLGASEGALATFAHPPQAESAGDLRARLYGHALNEEQYLRLLRDAVAGRLSDIELAAFVAAGVGDRVDLEETVALTRAMVRVGDRLQWPRALVVDKHCVGGLPGNRTTPIVVAIVAAAGLLIPKTSSRAITSPAGTADTMAVLAPVDLDLAAMRRVVEREGGCLVWGGAANLSPADDTLIRVERPLDVDSDTQLTASVLSKKLAAGATHVVLDLPVGPTAKIRSVQAAQALGARLLAVARATGLHATLRVTDGTQPVGNGIGPALEARDVLAVLRGEPDAPDDLRASALELAGVALEFDPAVRAGEGRECACRLLRDGSAWRKFEAICVAQGGLSEPPQAPQRIELPAPRSGIVSRFDNRRLARLAKLAGAPRAPAAGLRLHAHVGQPVAPGEPLLTLHAQTRGELDYARGYFARHTDMIVVEDAP
ncbi:thymidine phosphorylase family protein [Dokdonella ginsengisoli]|uniref:Putative thymidine phosphorylase n=1 Tax=Dokdonella ginsengisoli TaxID=363846 RepID=A0ABV9QYA8_9GAMM